MFVLFVLSHVRDLCVCVLNYVCDVRLCLLLFLMVVSFICSCFVFSVYICDVSLCVGLCYVCFICVLWFVLVFDVCV